MFARELFVHGKHAEDGGCSHDHFDRAGGGCSRDPDLLHQTAASIQDSIDPLLFGRPKTRLLDSGDAAASITSSLTTLPLPLIFTSSTSSADNAGAGNKLFLGATEVTSTSCTHPPSGGQGLPIQSPDRLRHTHKLFLPTISAKLISGGQAIVTDPAAIRLLTQQGCYGQLVPRASDIASLSEQDLLENESAADVDNVPCQEVSSSQYFHEYSPSTDDDEEEVEDNDQEFPDRFADSRLGPPASHDDALALNDVEILFLFHALGCLQVELPMCDEPRPDPPTVLWYNLCTANCQPVIPSASLEKLRSKAPFARRERSLLRSYVAYLYYRSRGWIVRSGRGLGGLDFLLYAESPDARHAAYGVLIEAFPTVPSSSSVPTTKITAGNSEDVVEPRLSCADVAVFVRVAHSVGKRLIHCRVKIPDQLGDQPWDTVRQSAVMETLIDWWNPRAKSTV